MSRPPAAALAILATVVALWLVASPAYAGFSFPVFAPAVMGSTHVDDKDQPDRSSSGNRVIDDSFNGKSFGADKNEVLIVQLKETDPAQSWKYTGQGSFTIIDETVLELYPALHDFRVRVRGPGDLMFAKVDRNGDVVDRFGVHVVIREPEPKRDVVTRYPLYDFFAISLTPGLLCLWQ